MSSLNKVNQYTQRDFPYLIDSCHWVTEYSI